MVNVQVEKIGLVDGGNKIGGGKKYVRGGGKGGDGGGLKVGGFDCDFRCWSFEEGIDDFVTNGSGLK